MTITPEKDAWIENILSKESEGKIKIMPELLEVAGLLRAENKQLLKRLGIETPQKVQEILGIMIGLRDEIPEPYKSFIDSALRQTCPLEYRELSKAIHVLVSENADLQMRIEDALADRDFFDFAEHDTRQENKRLREALQSIYNTCSDCGISSGKDGDAWIAAKAGEIAKEAIRSIPTTAHQH